jgi:hypothetical protein
VRADPTKSVEATELVRGYEQLAREHGEAIASANARAANRLFDRIMIIYQELRRRGPVAQTLLLPLLNSEDMSVRYWAATHALDFAPALGERALESIIRGPKGLIRFNAEMTLEQWHKGLLSFEPPPK